MGGRGRRTAFGRPNHNSMASKPKPKGEAMAALVQRIVDEFAVSPQMATSRVSEARFIMPPAGHKPKTPTFGVSHISTTRKKG